MDNIPVEMAYTLSKAQAELKKPKRKGARPSVNVDIKVADVDYGSYPPSPKFGGKGDNSRNSQAL